MKLMRTGEKGRYRTEDGRVEVFLQIIDAGQGERHSGTRTWFVEVDGRTSFMDFSTRGEAARWAERELAKANNTMGATR